MKKERLLIIGIRGLNGYNPEFISASLKSELDSIGNGKINSIDHMTLEFHELIDRGNIFPAEIAKKIDDLDIAWKLAQKIRDSIKGLNITAIALPPVLGVKKFQEVYNLISDTSGVKCFELISFPPSVPGIRLQNTMEAVLTKKGIKTINGEVYGFKEKDGAIKEIFIKKNGRETSVSAHAVILASGKYLTGGIRKQDIFSDSIFNLPVFYKDKRLENMYVGDLTYREFLSSHPLFSVGLKVNADLQPLDENEEIIYKNLYGAGGLLGGYNYMTEKCGLGVALFTGYEAGINALKTS